jgi:pimeloyl-ACP methyl ester carboxylesterase
MLATKPIPSPSARLLFFPSSDTEYVFFENSVTVPFTPTPAFSLTNAWWLADSALLSYWPPEQARSAFTHGGFGDTQFFSVDSTQCYVASTDSFVVVSFRGTEITQLEDDLTDARAELVTWSVGGRVHQGFAGALESVWQSLELYLRSLPRVAVWFTGHSLGAALATLAAMRWRILGGDVGGIYTVGSPRVGDAAFADACDRALHGLCFRYVNGSDSVTQCPPEEWGYRHVGEQRSIGGASASHPVLAGLEAPFLDHTPRRYATLIWNELANSAVAGPSSHS